MQPLTWYLPSFYGDIRLESKDRQHTLVTYWKLTPEESIAMQTLFAYAIRKGWASDAECKDRSANLGTLVKKEQSLWVKAKITDVQKVLERPLKPGRKTVSVVRFGDGAIEEVTSSSMGLVETEGKTVDEKPTTAPRPVKKRLAVATTVAVPVVGCPAPDFAAAEIRASRVLEAFLTPVQIEDFRTENAFVAQGADTGTQYMITSRHAKTTLGGTIRSLYDLDRRRPICVHDWSVPAAEEMLALLVMVSVPGGEHYCRGLPADGVEVELGADDPFPPLAMPIPREPS
jgi:hypothetical protein